MLTVPALALANENTGVPAKFTSSFPITPVKVAVPATVAFFVPSYILFTPLNPVKLIAFAVILKVTVRVPV